MATAIDATTLKLTCAPEPWESVGDSWTPTPDEAAALDAAGVVEALVEQHALRAMIETSRLVLAWRFAHTYDDLPHVAATSEHHHARRVALAGAGAPLVHEHAPLELALHLQMSPQSGRTLMGAALEIAHRLPRLWQRLLDGELEAWRAREVARETLSLAPEIAAAVDDLLAETSRAINQVTADDLILEALLVLDPEEAARREARHDDGRAVFVSPPTGPQAVPGLPGRWAEVHARLDAPDAEALDRTLDAIARILADAAAADADDPDSETHQQRRATALGLLADPHAAAALLDGGTRPTPRPATLYVHVDALDLANLLDGGADHGATLEAFGPATLTLASRWLRDRQITLRPVIDLAADPTTDVHDPTETISEHVVLRDRTCIVPDCRRRARSCDQDHIDPYRHPDDGGPPGQTCPSNLQSLCRSHHRLKTHAPARFALLMAQTGSPKRRTALPQSTPRSQSSPSSSRTSDSSWCSYG